MTARNMLLAALVIAVGISVLLPRSRERGPVEAATIDTWPPVAALPSALT